MRTHKTLVKLVGTCGIAAAAGACVVSANVTPTDTATTHPVPATSVITLTPQAPDTLAELGASRAEVRDRYDLAARFLGIHNIPTELAESTLYEEGDTAAFWVQNIDSNQTIQVDAQLVYMGQVVAMWVEKGLEYDPDAIRLAAEWFETDIYPTNREVFGSEPSPGIDGDTRLHILHTTALGPSVAGYFYSPSEYPASIVAYSNQKEMFYVNMMAVTPGDDYYASILSHEFQHMIHWNVDRDEESWLNEGLSELASYLNGFGPSDFTSYFLQNPDLQLTTWPEAGSGQAHYGAAFLFTAYFMERFGSEAVSALVTNPDNGLSGIDSTLADIGQAENAEALFGDWVIANLLNSRGSLLHGYANIPDLPTPGLAAELSSYPGNIEGVVHQYGADYVRLNGPASVRVRFEGENGVRILPTSTVNIDNDPTSEDVYAWWSGRGDESDSMLTRSVDLRGLNRAILSFDTWYALEEGWDYGYVTVSGDGGQTWTILRGGHSSDLNPHGNAYGPAYTGTSAAQMGANAEGWLHEEIDLSVFAGREILLRFETITDDAVNLPGMAVDNICIEDTGWCDDAEAVSDAWVTQGWVRHANTLPQRFLVRLVVPGDGGDFMVMPFTLDAANTGEAVISIGEQPAFLVVSAMTRYTTESAPYRVEITPLTN